jgi:HK97 gp10 family phage protein
MEFANMGALAIHLLEAEAATLRALEIGLDSCATHVKKVAKEEIGEYQPAVGPFQDWAELADSTEADKARKGYPLDAPLLRTGEMRDEITHEVSGLEAVAGAKDEGAGKILQYHEFGTSKMPPRPVLGPAMFRSRSFIQERLGAAVLSGLFHGAKIDSSLGYDGETSEQ